jgi:hypothetical protein
MSSGYYAQDEMASVSEQLRGLFTISRFGKR